jgi:hypothetical protein
MTMKNLVTFLVGFLAGNFAEKPNVKMEKIEKAGGGGASR